MSHFVRCDRCTVTEFRITPNLTLPPGWQRVLSSDLCELCCKVVRDFIDFKPARLPIEPIPTEPPPPPSVDGEKLFETAFESQVSADVPTVSGQASNGESVPKPETDGDLSGKTQPASAECSREERTKTRRIIRAKLRGQDAISPDPHQSQTNNQEA